MKVTFEEDDWKLELDLMKGTGKINSDVGEVVDVIPQDIQAELLKFFIIMRLSLMHAKRIKKEME
jgi:hypothetical protein